MAVQELNFIHVSRKKASETYGSVSSFNTGESPLGSVKEPGICRLKVLKAHSPGVPEVDFNLGMQQVAYLTRAYYFFSQPCQTFFGQLTALTSLAV